MQLSNHQVGGADSTEELVNIGQKDTTPCIIMGN